MEPAFSQDLAPIRIEGINYPPLVALARIKGTLKKICNISADGGVLSAGILEPVDRPLEE